MSESITNHSSYGSALASAFGVTDACVLALQSHILTTLAGPKPAISVNGAIWPIRSGAFIAVGPKARLGSLIDQLLFPVQEIQQVSSHARKPFEELIEAQNLSLNLERTLSGLRAIDTVLAINEKREQAIDEFSKILINREAVLKPVLLLDGVKPEEVVPLSHGSKDSSPLWYDRNCMLVETSAARLKALVPWLTGHEQKNSRDADSKHSRIGYLGVIEQESLLHLAACNRDVVDPLVGFANIMHVQDISEPIPTLGSIRNQYIEELAVWREAVEKVVKLRNSEEVLHVYDEPCLDALLYRHRQNLDANGKVDTKCDSQLLNDLMLKMFFGLSLLKSSGAVFKKHVLDLASGLHKFLHQHQIYSERIIAEQANQSTLDQNKARIVRALERRGPCSWPELRRSFDVQRRDAHEDAINSLIASGELTLGDDSIFRLKKDNHAA